MIDFWNKNKKCSNKLNNNENKFYWRKYNIFFLQIKAVSQNAKSVFFEIFSRNIFDLFVYTNDIFVLVNTFLQRIGSNKFAK